MLLSNFDETGAVKFDLMYFFNIAKMLGYGCQLIKVHHGKALFVMHVMFWIIGNCNFEEFIMGGQDFLKNFSGLMNR